MFLAESKKDICSNFIFNSFTLSWHFCCSLYIHFGSLYRCSSIVCATTFEGLRQMKTAIDRRCVVQPPKDFKSEAMNSALSSFTCEVPCTGNAPCSKLNMSLWLKCIHIYLEDGIGIAISNLLDIL